MNNTFEWPVNGLGRANPISNREKVCWTPPKEGWVKINFDGASIGNPGVLGCGCVTRDHKGNILAYGAKHLNDGTNIVAEFCAPKEALVLGVKLGIHRVHLEGDSEIIINGITRGSRKRGNLINTLSRSEDC